MATSTYDDPLVRGTAAVAAAVGGACAVQRRVPLSRRVVAYRPVAENDVTDEPFDAMMKTQSFRPDAATRTDSAFANRDATMVVAPVSNTDRSI